MNKSNTKKTVLNQKISSKRPNEFKKIYNYKNELLWAILIGIIVAIMLFSRNLLLTFIVFLGFLSALLILIEIPLLWILIRITLHTKCSDFAFQVFIYLQIIPIAILSIVDLASALETQSLWTPSAFWVPIVLFPGIIVFQLSRIKKPIFGDGDLSNYTAPLISRRSVETYEELDGYSQRSISSEFQSLEDLIPSPSHFKEQLENYCIFLGKQGELIDWHIEESFAILYPRFLINAPNLLKPLKFWQFLRRLHTKKNMTSIEISLSPAQISLNIAFHDYNILNREVTFHTLSLNVLESVKQSLTAYFHNDLEAAHQKMIGRIEKNSSLSK
jgi:hypothetical protein